MQLFVLNFCELQFSKFSCQFRLIQMQLKKQKEPFVKWNRILLNPAASQNTSSVVRTLWSVPLSLSLQARVFLLKRPSAAARESSRRRQCESHWEHTVLLLRETQPDAQTQVGGARGRARERGAGLRGRGLIRTLERNMGGACHSLSLSLSEQRAHADACVDHMAAHAALRTRWIQAEMCGTKPEPPV